SPISSTRPCDPRSQHSVATATSRSARRGLIESSRRTTHHRSADVAAGSPADPAPPHRSPRALPGGGEQGGRPVFVPPAASPRGLAIHARPGSPRELLAGPVHDHLTLEDPPPTVASLEVVEVAAAGDTEPVGIVLVRAVGQEVALDVRVVAVELHR